MGRTGINCGGEKVMSRRLLSWHPSFCRLFASRRLGVRRYSSAWRRLRSRNATIIVEAVGVVSPTGRAFPVLPVSRWWVTTVVPTSMTFVRGSASAFPIPTPSCHRPRFKTPTRTAVLPMTVACAPHACWGETATCPTRPSARWCRHALTFLPLTA